MEPPINLTVLYRECVKRAVSSARPPVKILLGPQQMNMRLRNFEENTGKKPTLEIMQNLHFRGLPVRLMQADGIALVTQP